MKIHGKKISNTSMLHFAKMIFRSVLFIVAFVLYVFFRATGRHGEIMDYISRYSDFLWVVAVIYIVEMTLRFFPSSMESKGCQKQFETNYHPSGKGELPRIGKAQGTVLVVVSWVVLNGFIAALYYAHVIDEGIMILIALAYSVCDMICILFFCPFQTWMLKNKCCGTCRIYNWDYIMMFTPCIFIPNFMARVLFLLALILFVQWEYLYRKYPERFAENTNDFLTCVNCTEKLCSHKVQLQHYLVQFHKMLAEERMGFEKKLENAIEVLEESQKS